MGASGVGDFSTGWNLLTVYMTACLRCWLTAIPLQQRRRQDTDMNTGTKLLSLRPYTAGGKRCVKRMDHFTVFWKRGRENRSPTLWSGGASWKPDVTNKVFSRGGIRSILSIGVILQLTLKANISCCCCFFCTCHSDLTSQASTPPHDGLREDQFVAMKGEGMAWFTVPW